MRFVYYVLLLFRSSSPRYIIPVYACSLVSRLKARFPSKKRHLATASAVFFAGSTMSPRVKLSDLEFSNESNLKSWLSGEQWRERVISFNYSWFIVPMGTGTRQS